MLAFSMNNFLIKLPLLSANNKSLIRCRKESKEQVKVDILEKLQMTMTLKRSALIIKKYVLLEFFPQLHKSIMKKKISIIIIIF